MAAPQHSIDCGGLHNQDHDTNFLGGFKVEEWQFTLVNQDLVIKVCVRGKSRVKSKLKSSFVVIVSVCCALGVATWKSTQWWPQLNPHDFEQCSEQASRNALSKDERISLTAQCDKQFVGRRKGGGGYTYYDFLQNRHFDIAGPNPTPKELRYFDEQYTLYLDAQRIDKVAAADAVAADAVAAALAEKQSQMEQPDSQDDRLTGSTSPPGPPMVIAPTKVPLPRARSSVVRSKDLCEDASLSCSWTKFSEEIKKFLGSNAKANRP